MTSVISTKRSASASDKRMRSPIQVRTQKKQPNQKTINSTDSNKPSSSSGNLRIKVRLSDNRTDIMELAKGTA